MIATSKFPSASARFRSSWISRPRIQSISLKLASYPATGTLSLPDRILSPQSSLMADDVDELRYEAQIGSATPSRSAFKSVPTTHRNRRR